MWDNTAKDPTITEATVMYRRIAKVGDRVRHLGQVYAQGSSTATVLGFHYDCDAPTRDWIKVHVQPDKPDDAYGNTWDWDRTVLA